jgi:hypothetical protein
MFLDEAHPAHVGGEIVDFIESCPQDSFAFMEVAQISNDLEVRRMLIPMLQFFDVNAYDFMTGLNEMPRQPAADEAAGSSH